MNEPWTFSQHAVKRWMERIGTGCNPERAKNRMRRALAIREWLYRNRWYANGVVFVIDGWHVVTVFKPARQKIMRRIFQMKEAKRIERSLTQP